MGRRASSSISPVWLLLLIGAITITAGLGFFVFKMVNDLYRTQEELNISVYLENASSLRGNIYKCEGDIHSLVSWNPIKGRLISITTGTGGAGDIIPLLVPEKFNDQNLQKGQHFEFLIKVEDAGIIHVQDLRKI